MGLKREYDLVVKRLNAATVAVLTVVLIMPAAFAQSKGAPASVTSTGFGGSTGPRGTPASVTSSGFGAQSHRAPALPPSVTSIGFQQGSRGATSHSSSGSHSSRSSQPGSHPHPGNSHHGSFHRGDHNGGRGAIYGVPYFYPYTYDAGQYDENQPVEQPAEDEYLGGPTIFDRRGPGTGRPAEDENYAEEKSPSKPAPVAEEEPVSNQPDTLLVFKDGHQLEVSNYAIVGTTLFDLSDGHRHRIPLSELNLTATAKENDDRGIDFQLPAGVKVD
jgi:hypothetical protein